MNTPNPPEVLTTAQVLAKEREEVESQRKVRFSGEPNRPAKDQNHVGLCFSGGGIRSATLNLGILQGLQETGVLKQVDYLSTVSGGGYIGSWFCATRHRLAAAAKAKNKAAAELLEDDRFLIEDKAPGCGSPMLRHLRQHARYLAPEAGITSGDFWTMVSIWTRNTLLMQLTVLSALFFLISFLQAVPAVFQWLVRDSGLTDGSPNTLWWGMFYIQIGCILGATLIVVMQLLHVAWKKKDYRSAWTWAPALGITVLLAAASLCGGVQVFDRFVDGSQSVWKDPACQRFAAALALCGSLVMLTSHLSVKKFKLDPLSVVKAVLIQLITYVALTASVLAIIWLLATVFKAIGAAHFVPTFEPTTPDDYQTTGAIVWSCVVSVPMLLGGYGLVMIVAIGLLGRQTGEAAMEWLARAGAWLLMALVLSGLVLAIAVAGPVWMDYLFSDAVSNWLRSSIIGGWVAGSIGAVVMGQSESTRGGPSAGGMKEKLLGLLPLVLLIGLLISLSWLVRAAYLYVLEDCHENVPHGIGGFVLEYFFHGEGFGPVWIAVTGVSGLAALLLIWRVDINQFSMNPFYRNRLVRCYVGASRMHEMKEEERYPHATTGFDFDDDMYLTSFAGEEASKVGYPGPFQIVNTAANTGASAGLDVQDRSAESFIFTPLHAGFDFSRHSMPKTKRETKEPHPLHRAFCETKRYGGGWTLGHALSVSGAAASPNSGYHTSPLVAFMLTIFNARLGWWAPHPDKEKAEYDRPRGLFGFLGCLINELTGSASLDKEFIYLSDGGHFENLGLYELVRRRCKVIIVGDGECDPIYNFQALGTAIRRCQVDFGAKINIETCDIVPNPATGVSRSHGAFGTITYEDGKTGLLIYLKASMTGDESLAVRQFRGENLTFPHESTGDQFFSESQFESYRELGRHIAREIFAPVSALDLQGIKKNPKPPAVHNKKPAEDFHGWLGRLEKFWKPPPRIASTGFINHTLALTEIWQQIANDPALAAFDEELMPEWSKLVKTARSLLPDLKSTSETPPPVTETSPSRKAAYISQEIIQLMENVYLDLDLHHDADHEDHRGWMMLFRYWASRPVIRDAFERSRHLFGDRFERFWIEVLGKGEEYKSPPDIVWQEKPSTPPESQLS